MKLFTPHEATQTLPLVKNIVRDILKCGKKMQGLNRALGQETEHSEEFLESLERLKSLFAELDQIGCSYRDYNFNVGLVDFPSVIDEEQVLLCWKSDEESLQYYHGYHDGFAGRKLIPEYCFQAPQASCTAGS